MFDTVFEALAHLPVNSIREDVADAYFNGVIPIVTSEVGSGKTLLIAPTLATQLEELIREGVMAADIDQTIYVLEPSRSLAANAVENLWEILGEDDETAVGIINSPRSGEPSYVADDTKVVFTTIGYAVASGLIEQAFHFVIDEAHDTSIDMSLAKAILNKRSAEDPRVRFAVMSATIDTSDPRPYLNESQVFHTAGQGHPVEYHHKPGEHLGDMVEHLITECGASGILVFVEGFEDIKDAINDIVHTLDKNPDTQSCFEVYGVHGNSSAQDRRAAFGQPQYAYKITVGTNVLESGLSLPWVNAGVSNGMTKRMHVRGNVHFLKTENLPQWRITQQMGRVNRFGPGTFILTGADPMESRPLQDTPDINRLPLTELVMQCTKLDQIDVRKLPFLATEMPDRNQLTEAVRYLENFGLIGADADGIFMTEDGENIKNLPTGFEAAAAYSEAIKLGAEADMIPLIASMEIGDIRHDIRSPLGGDRWTCSDIINRAYVVAQMMYYEKVKKQDIQDIAERMNVSLRKYNEYHRIVQQIERAMDIRANLRCYLYSTDAQKATAEKTMKQVIFRGMSGTVSTYSSLMHRVVLRTDGSRYGIDTASVSRNSVCNSHYGDELIATGRARLITPKNKRPFTTFEDVTLYSREDLAYLIPRFGRSVVDPDNQLLWVNNTSDDKQNRSIFFNKGSQSSAEDSKKVGTFGDILKMALAK